MPECSFIQSLCFGASPGPKKGGKGGTVKKGGKKGGSKKR
jgi:hypothetical protein